MMFNSKKVLGLGQLSHVNRIFVSPNKMIFIFTLAVSACSNNSMEHIDQRSQFSENEDQRVQIDPKKQDPAPTPKENSPSTTDQPIGTPLEKPKTTPPIDDTGLPPVDMVGPIGGQRPVEVEVPVQFNAQAGTKYPLIVLLHGFNSDGLSQDRYLGLSKLAREQGYVFAAPNGTPTLGTTGRFWNATESCCNFTNIPVDDIRYLRDLIRQIVARYAVDPGRVYLFGHSNGAFMAHRLACEESTRIAAIAALAGGLSSQVENCKPKTPVAVLTIHGTNDATIRFNGGQTLPTLPPYPSALATVNHWAKVNNCAIEPKRGSPFNLLQQSTSNESTPLVFESCAEKGTAELWQIEGGSHIPNFNSQFIPRVLNFFSKYKK